MWGDLATRLRPTVLWLQTWTGFVVFVCCMFVEPANAAQLATMYAGFVLSSLEDMVGDAAGKRGVILPNIFLGSLVAGLFVMGFTMVYGERIDHLSDLISTLILGVAAVNKKIVHKNE